MDAENHREFKRCFIEGLRSRKQHPRRDTTEKEESANHGRRQPRATSGSSPSRPRLYRRPGPPLTAAAGLPRGRGRGCARPARGGNGPGRCVRGSPGTAGSDRERPGRAEEGAWIPGARPRRRQRPNGPGRPWPALPGTPPSAALGSAPKHGCRQPKRSVTLL